MAVASECRLLEIKDFKRFHLLQNVLFLIKDTRW